MKLTRLEATNFAGLAAADIDLSAQVNLFTGGNNQGKSSVLDAIQFALLGKARGVVKAKDHAELAHDGDAKAMAVTVTGRDGDTEFEITRNAKSGFRGTLDTPLLPYCLDPLAFLRLPISERGAILSRAQAGGDKNAVKAAIRNHLGELHSEIAAFIKDAGVDLYDIDALRDGFVQARRSFKRERDGLVTVAPDRESYDVPDGFDPKKAAKELAAIETRLENGNRLLATQKVYLDRQSEAAYYRKQVVAMRKELQNPGKGNDWDDLVAAVQQAETLQNLLMQAAEKGVCPVCRKAGTPKDFVEIGNELVAAYQKNKKIVERVQAIDAENAETQKHIDIAKAKLEVAEAWLAKPENKPQVAEDAAEVVSGIKAERDRVAYLLDQQKAYQAAVGAAKNAKARADVLAALIDECNEACELLADGGPIQQAVAQSGTALPIPEELADVWDCRLTVKDNGAILLNGRVVELASDSEQYRAAGMLAMALAQIGRVGICAFDGFEILEPKHANAFLNVVNLCDLETVLIFRTTRKDYAGQLPDWLNVYKVDSGTVASVRECVSL